MELAEFKTKLKSGSLGGWYIFTGDEDYLKKYYLKELKTAASGDEAFWVFNSVSFDGADIDFAAVKEAIKSPPMMNDYKYIEWKFANLDALKESERNALEELFSLREEYPYSIFAIMTTEGGFDTGTAKKPSKLATRLLRGFDIIILDRSTDSQLLSWLKKHFDAEGIKVDAATLGALLFRSGHSMEILNNEVSKLSCYAKANGLDTVTQREVELIASPTVECDAFALSNAVIEKNISRAFEAMADLKARRVEPPAIIGMLERTYAELAAVALLLDEGKGAADIEALLKIHPFKAKLCIGAAKKIGSRRLAASLAELGKIDAASKAGGMSGYGVIEMFITQNISNNANRKE